jgi:thiosulfate dehydrogenase
LEKKQNNDPDYPEAIARLINVIIVLLLVIVLLVVTHITGLPKKGGEKKAEVVWPDKPEQEKSKTSGMWQAPDTTDLTNDPKFDLIKYGRNLVVNTGYYFGPHGKILSMSNGMNCQNCHLSAGTVPFGNNYGGVASTYPKFRERSGGIESIYKRVNDCFERSLNGKSLDTLSKEMQAISAYIKWLGKDVPKGEKPKGSGLLELAYLNRAADPENGKKVYTLNCERCHSANGEGQPGMDAGTYKYPPVWGEHSYNIGAGLYRLSRLAGYVKANMPQGATFENPQLTDEEAWDVAAFVNSQPRPKKDLSNDWPKISGKPVDHPFGPYSDKFSEKQHKYGPFKAIANAKKLNKKL